MKRSMIKRILVSAWLWLLLPVSGSLFLLTGPITRLTLEGSEFVLKADLVLLSMGFLHPIQEGMLNDFGVEFDQRGNVATKNFQTSVANIYAAGDMATGQSLVVRAINSGREMAKAIDAAIKGYTHLS